MKINSIYKTIYMYVLCEKVLERKLAAETIIPIKSGLEQSESRTSVS